MIIFHILPFFTFTIKEMTKLTYRKKNPMPETEVIRISSVFPDDIILSGLKIVSRYNTSRLNLRHFY